MNLRSASLLVATLLCLLTIELPAQIITNVTPPLGTHGEWVNIYGSGFAPGGHAPSSFSVDFNGTNSTTAPIAVQSDNWIQITNIPAKATTGPIHVFINGNKATSPQDFVVISTNAYVTNFTQIYGGTGSSVDIRGVHFITGGITNASFNGVLALAPTLINDNLLSVTVPGNVTTGPIIVISSKGASHNFSTISNQISSATNFFVQPAITSFSPTNGRPGTNVVITGTNFTAAAGVSFGGVTASDFTISNNTTIRATVPANVSTATISVSPPPGTVLPSAFSPLTFRVLPSITAISPKFGPTNTAVTVTGSALNEKLTHPDVTVGGATVVTFGTISASSLTFNIPANASSGLITITTTNGSITSTDIFYLPPVIASFAPASGPAGTLVQITGNNFTNASAVSFNGTPATTFVVTNNTTIGAVAPAGITSGIITVTTPFGSTNSSAFFYVPPTITSFAPTHGLPGISVTITGTSFTNASAVDFNGTPAASFVVSNNTTISAVVPATATTGPITVTAPGGTGQSATAFTLDSTDLSISVSAQPSPVFVGSNLVYLIVITNSGPVTAFNVRFTNTLSPTVTLQSASVTQGTLATNANPILGTIGDLANHTSASVLLTVKPSVIGSVTNTASAGTDSLDPNSANNSVTTMTTVWPLPLLSIANLQSNNLVQISWPAPLIGFTLQANGNLATNQWSNDTSPKVVSGTNVSVIETNLGAPRFFRLTN